MLVPSQPLRSSAVVVPAKEKDTDKKPGISVVQKVTVKQNEPKTKKRKSTITAKRKEYNALKRKTIAAIQKGKTAAYKRENEVIKKMPVKQRKAARAKLKATLQDRKNALVKQLPKAGKMTLADLAVLISKVKKLKW